MQKKELDINDIIAYMRGKEQHPIMHVKDTDDPDYKTMRRFIMDIWPKTDDYIGAISGQMNKLMSSLRYMEPNDYNRIVNTFKKYEVEGSQVV